MLTIGSFQPHGLLRSLQQTRATFDEALGRISTGVRAQSAGDDPAAIVKANTLRSEIGALSAQRENAVRLGSMVDAASAGVASQRALLEGIRALAVSAASETLSSSDRENLQEEVTALAADFDRIATTTTFGGRHLLDGSLASHVFSLGASGSPGIALRFSSTRAIAIGSVAEVSGSALTLSPLSAGELVINGVSIGAAQASDDTASTADAAASAIATAAAVNRADAGVIATAGATIVHLGAVSAGSFAAGDLIINGEDIGAVTVLAGDSDDALVAAINAVGTDTGVTAELNGLGELVLTAADGRNITTSGASTDGGGVLATDPGIATYTGRLILTSGSDIVIGGTDPASAGLTAGTTLVDETSSVATLDVFTQASAEATIRQIDQALLELSAVEAGYAAASSRIEVAQASLASTEAILSEGLSRTIDADVASEEARLAAAEILIRSQLALLAQASSLGRGSIELLLPAWSALGSTPSFSPSARR